MERRAQALGLMTETERKNCVHRMMLDLATSGGKYNELTATVADYRKRKAS